MKHSTSRAQRGLLNILGVEPESSRQSLSSSGVSISASAPDLHRHLLRGGVAEFQNVAGLALQIFTNGRERGKPDGASAFRS